VKLAESKELGPHRELARFVGEWSGTAKTWFEPDVIGDESPMTGNFRPVLDGRFLLYEYQGELQGKPFEGLAIFGFDLATEKFQSAWVDSFHMSTAIMFSEGDAGDNFSAAGTYYTGEASPRWGWRTQLEQIDEETIVLTAWNLTPEGEAAKATETVYKRKN